MPDMNSPSIKHGSIPAWADRASIAWQL